MVVLMVALMAALKVEQWVALMADTSVN